MKVGRHIKLSDGPNEIIKYGIDAIQVFTKGPQQYFATNVPEALEFGDVYVCAHAGYLIHLKHGPGSMSAKALLHEAERCAIIGIPDLVCHFSSAPLQPQLELIKSISDKWPQEVRLLVENNCREPWELNSELADLANSYIPCDICFDTAHAWGAGTLEKDWPTNAALYHVNDSAVHFNTRKDRHANLCHGTIPIEAFEFFRKVDAPLVMETPECQFAFDDLRILREILDGIH